MSRPVPAASTLTRPFWDGCRAHRLLVPECGSCFKRFFEPDLRCPHCGAERWLWEESPGVGVVYSRTVIHRPASAAFRVPYVLASIELDDGWCMLSNVVHCDPYAVEIGTRVVVTFEEIVGGVTIPVFEPSGQPSRTSPRVAAKGAAPNTLGFESLRERRNQ